MPKMAFRFRLLNCEMVRDDEQNEHYDVRTSNNGGGYHQPFRVWDLMILEDETVVKYRFTYDDTSCGDFGDRYSKRLQRMSFDEKGNGKVEIIGDFYYNNVEGDEKCYGEGTFDANPITAILLSEGLLTWFEVSKCEPFQKYVKEVVEW